MRAHARTETPRTHTRTHTKSTAAKYAAKCRWAVMTYGVLMEIYLPKIGHVIGRRRNEKKLFVCRKQHFIIILRLIRQDILSKWKRLPAVAGWHIGLYTQQVALLYTYICSG